MRFIIVLLVLGIITGSYFAIPLINEMRKPVTVTKAIEPSTKEKEINAIIESTEFQAQVLKEAEKQYYTKQLNEAKENLLKLQGEGFITAKKVN